MRCTTGTSSLWMKALAHMKQDAETLTKAKPPSSIWPSDNIVCKPSMTASYTNTNIVPYHTEASNDQRRTRTNQTV